VHEGEFVVGSSSHNPLPLRAQTSKALEEEWTSF